MPDHACRFVNASPPAAPCAKTEVQILTVRWIKQPVKSAYFIELFSIDSHEAARRKQGMTRLLMLRVESPVVKAVVKLQTGRTTSNLPSVPIEAPCRNRKDVRRLEMSNQRSKEIVIDFQVVIQKHEDVFSSLLREPV